jgi:hypothetical protein
LLYFAGLKLTICRCKRHEAKRIQTKHALKAVRYERKQLETFSKNNSIKDSTIDKHSRSTRKCREESKKRQGERENTQIVSTKQAARKGNFTFLKRFQAQIKTIMMDKHQKTIQTTSQTNHRLWIKTSAKQGCKKLIRRRKKLSKKRLALHVSRGKSIETITKTL